MLTLWPSVQFLGYSSAHPLPLPPPERPPGLKLLEIGYNAEPISEALQWLIPNHTLRCLKAKGGVGGTTRPLLIREGEYLRSVRFLLLEPISASLLALCPNLEELDINRIVPPAADPTGIFKPIPKSIQHLRVRDPIRRISSVLPLVSHLPNLRVLTLPVFREEDLIREDCREEWEKIKRVCLERGIFLVNDPSAIGLEDDAVMVERFPRGRSASNFRFMN